MRKLYETLSQAIAFAMSFWFFRTAWLLKGEASSRKGRMFDALFHNELLSLAVLAAGCVWFLYCGFKKSKTEETGIQGGGAVVPSFIIANYMAPFVFTIFHPYWGVDDQMFSLIMRGYICASIVVAGAYMLFSKEFGGALYEWMQNNAKSRARRMLGLLVASMSTVVLFFFSVVREVPYDKLAKELPFLYLILSVMFFGLCSGLRYWGMERAEARSGVSDQ
jgi:protein-S-isoprenylcysteine O-methyltransferase Ste14